MSKQLRATQYTAGAVCKGPGIKTLHPQSRAVTLPSVLCTQQSNCLLICCARQRKSKFVVCCAVVSKQLRATQYTAGAVCKGPGIKTLHPQSKAVTLPSVPCTQQSNCLLICCAGRRKSKFVVCCAGVNKQLRATQYTAGAVCSGLGCFREISCIAFLFVV